MLRKLGKIPLVYGQFVGRSDISPCNMTFAKKIGFLKQIFNHKNFHISIPAAQKDIKGQARKRTDDETNISHSSHKNMYPDADLPDRVFNGTLFKNLPIVNVKVSRNNTIMNLTDYKGFPKLIRSCGVEGFRNTKKGTNIAAQATAMTFTRKALDMGYKTVRVRIQGLGPGRISSIRGMVIGGFDIVSITDNSPVADVYPRPKKMRRI